MLLATLFCPPLHSTHRTKSLSPLTDSAGTLEHELGIGLPHLLTPLSDAAKNWWQMSALNLPTGNLGSKP